MNAPAQRYNDFIAHISLGRRMRNVVRDGAVTMASVGCSIKRSSGWIRFPYYHHVFEDELAGFSRQLEYLGRFGDFISLSDAVGMLEKSDSIDGNYFCITFDDGFKNNATNAAPILLDKGIPAAFFLVTDLIGTNIERDRARLLKFFNSGQVLIEFLNWQDCRQLANAGMVIGSHTVHHVRLSELDEGGVMDELITSKETIEMNLGRPCMHFCSPFGIPEKDFDSKRDPILARESGYRSMLTTKRGANRTGGSPFMIKRDHLLANWSIHQLRYFFSLD